ncbi:hypothetical protein K435DRAFT_860731 [Dendrothele bispora CBS 962.96]|uniref:Uncharacterized protein n=1 Tax=Dendrothele bispora (strain CBS 962.96) TaxID=1314807 RepID=A0A4S8LXA9_DENBC|nr:hypothetical protein K435DRAFT_860731 [Dendrothele bispora CBS 962.96]
MLKSLQEPLGVISASLSGVGTLIDLDTDGTHLNDTAVEGSTLASGSQVSCVILLARSSTVSSQFSSTALTSTQANNACAIQTQAQSTAAQATFSTTKTAIAWMSTATSPPSVPSASSSSVSQADATSTVPQSSSATSALTANTPAAYNGRNANNNSGLSTTLTSGSSP